jgi:hypothetical protein
MDWRAVIHNCVSNTLKNGTMDMFTYNSASMSFYTAEISTVQCYTCHKGQNQLNVKRKFNIITVY